VTERFDENLDYRKHAQHVPDLQIEAGLTRESACAQAVAEVARIAWDARPGLIPIVARQILFGVTVRATGNLDRFAMWLCAMARSANRGTRHECRGKDERNQTTENHVTTQRTDWQANPNNCTPSGKWGQF
jgi:hypothetical protein